MKQKKTIAFCGTRGLPANYGGFETAVDEISKQFVKEGYDCHIFTRLSGTKDKIDTFEGRKLEYVKGSENRKLDTFVSSIQTAMFILKNRKKYDYLFWFNNANFPGIFLTLFSGIPMSINTDGLEWKREKWSLPFKAYYFISSFLISLFCRSLISDSTSIQNYYRKTFFKKTSFIPYGAPEVESINEETTNHILNKYKLKNKKYFLQITRFEPDNLPLAILNGFHQSGLADMGYEYVLIGYKDETPYSIKIKEMSNFNGIHVLDAIYDKDTLTVLRANCFGYIHGNSVGGTNPALLEAMASCKRVMAIEGPFSREVLGDTGSFFTLEGLKEDFQAIISQPETGTAMKNRVYKRYNWNDVAKSYMNLANGSPADYQNKQQK
jgi:glycosyltransferase involved in cell wall biosynthesis